jgi:hypothetical protein
VDISGHFYKAMIIDYSEILAAGELCVQHFPARGIGTQVVQ